MAKNVPEQEILLHDNNLVCSEQIIVEAMEKIRDANGKYFGFFPPEIQTLLHYIQRHLFEPALTVQKAMAACGCGNNNTTSIFRQYLGIGPHEYIVREN